MEHDFANKVEERRALSFSVAWPPESLRTAAKPPGTTHAPPKPPQVQNRQQGSCSFSLRQEGEYLLGITRVSRQDAFLIFVVI